MCAHMSSLEQCKLQMKKVKKQRAKKQSEETQKLAEMTPEELAEYQKRKDEKSLKEMAGIYVYDINARQLPVSKYPQANKILKARVLEIESRQELHCEKEIQRIRGALNEMSYM